MQKTRATALLSLAVAATAVGGVAVSQATPPFALAPQAQSGDKVTKSFRDATVAEVLDWLQTRKVGFVVETASIPKDKRVTLSVTQASADDVVRAVASAIGMTVEKHGGVYALRPAGPAVVWSGGLGRSQGSGDAWERLRRIVPEFRWELRRLDGDGREIERRIRELTESGTAGVRVGGIGRVMESLTEEQWRVHDENGHLTLDDLTADQRRELGRMPEGPFTIVVERDGKRLTLKGQGR